MVRLSGARDRGTGAGAESRDTAAKQRRQQGRRLALGMISEQDSGRSVATDGGLSPAARAWMEATPGADLEDARRYDRGTGRYREITEAGPLPARGESGGPENQDRAVAVDVARHHLRRYLELEDRTD